MSACEQRGKTESSAIAALAQCVVQLAQWSKEEGVTSLLRLLTSAVEKLSSPREDLVEEFQRELSYRETLLLLGEVYERCVGDLARAAKWVFGGSFT